MIDNVKLRELDINSLTYDDIRSRIDHFASREVRRTRNPNGTYHREYEGYYYYETNIGRIDEDDYDKIALAVIHKNDDDNLLKAIKDHVKELAFMKGKSDGYIQHYAISCLLDKAYEAWALRGEFAIPGSTKPQQLDLFALI